MALQYEEFKKEFEVETSRLIHEFFLNRTWIEVGLYRGWRVALKPGRFLQKLGSHPNIIEFIAEVQDGEDRWILMEGVKDSQTLADYCRWGSESISIELGIRLLRQIVSGLGYLHEKRLIHHDLKPENVLDQDLRLRLLRVSRREGSRIRGAPTSRNATLEGPGTERRLKDSDHREDRNLRLEWTRIHDLVEVLSRKGHESSISNHASSASQALPIRRPREAAERQADHWSP